MRRQLYAGGGIASLTQRQQYGLGSIVKSVGKAVKGVGKAVGNIVSSDAGKLALLAAGAYYAPALLSGGALSPGLAGYTSGLGALKNIAASKFAGMSLLGKGATILGGTALMTSLFGSPQAAQQLYQRDPGTVKNYLGQYYKNVNPKKEGQSDEEYAKEVEDFVGKNIAEYDVSQSSTFAEGGRVGLAQGGLGNLNTFNVYQNYLNEIQDAQANQQSNILYNPTISYQTSDGDSETQTVADPTNPGISAREAVSNFTSNVRSGNFNIGNAIRGLAIAGPIGGFVGGFGSNRGNSFGVDSMAGMASGPTHGVDAVNEGSVGADASAGGAAGAAAASAAGSNDGPGGGTFAEGGRVMKGFGGLISQLISSNPEIFKKLQMASPVKQMQLQYMRNINPQMTEEETEEYIRENAAQGGLMNIPMGEPRMNQGGVAELDYREEGGFVPVGIKEKADDVPAMLSKNEFVMTADAVKGMGNGDVENGAQKMYNLMKSLENRIA